jgi:molybdate transport system substrate-binding protein
MEVKFLSGGAAQGLIDALAPQFAAMTGCGITGTFGAVGAMRDKLVAGVPADLVILTASLIGELVRSGHVVAGSAVDLGPVPTCVAIRAGDPAPDVGDADALRTAFRAADGIYFPDPALATAGIHFAGVLDKLGIHDEVRPRLRPYPNGATAMRALAASSETRPIGCTQATEILNTAGTVVVGPLPGAFALAAVYTAATCTRAMLPDQAHRLAELLAGAESRDLRRRLGFAV